MNGTSIGKARRIAKKGKGIISSIQARKEKRKMKRMKGNNAALLKRVNGFNGGKKDMMKKKRNRKDDSEDDKFPLDNDNDDEEEENDNQDSDIEDDMDGSANRDGNKRRKTSGGENEDTDDDDEDDDEEDRSIEDSNSKTKYKKVEQEVDPDDMEIEYLERKLGLKKKKKSVAKRIAKELQEEDGFDEEFLDLLGIGANDNEEEIQDDEDEDNEGENDKEDNDDHDDEGGETIYLPKQDLYGTKLQEQTIKKQEISQPKTENSEEMERIRKRMNGLINRVSEANVQPIATDIANLFQQRSVKETSFVFSNVLLDSMTKVTDAVAASQFSAVLTSVLIGVSAQIQGADNLLPSIFLESAVKRYEEEHKKREDINDETNKSSTNVAIMIAQLYMFGVVHYGIVFDILERIANKNESITAPDVDVFHSLLQDHAYQLRREDGARFKNVIRDVLAKIRENNDDIFHYFVEEVQNINDGHVQALRSRHDKYIDRITRLRKWTKQMISDSSALSSPLTLSWQDILDAETRGRWWIIGGVWNPGTAEDAQAKAAQPKVQRKLNAIQSALRKIPEEHLEIAKKHRMNTDLRQVTFCIIMNSSDYADAFQQIIGLSLNGNQEREMIRVLLHCCERSKDYNPFFGFLGQRLCVYNRGLAFSLQLAYWDFFREYQKEINYIDFKEKKKTENRIKNLSLLLAQIVSSHSLSLAMLKPINFSFIHGRIKVFLQHLVDTLLRLEMAEVVKVFSRVESSEVVKEGLILFLSSQDASSGFEMNSKEEIDGMTMKRRVKIVTRVLYSIDAKHSNNGDDENGKKKKNKKGERDEDDD